MKKTIMFLFIKEIFKYRYKQSNPVILAISVVALPLFFIGIYIFNLKLAPSHHWLSLYLSFLSIFLLAFISEIYFNPANRFLVFYPKNENLILFKRVLAKSSLYLLFLFTITVVLGFKVDKNLFIMIKIPLIVLSAFSSAYAIAFLIPYLTFSCGLFLGIPLLIKLYPQIKNFPLYQQVFALMLPSFFLILLKFRNKQTSSDNDIFSRIYLKTARMIFTIIRIFIKILPFSEKSKLFVGKDCYYLLSNTITIFTLALNIFIILVLSVVEIKTNYSIRQVVFFTYIFLCVFYFEKILSIFAGIENSGTILLRIFPVKIHKIIILKFLINTLMFLGVGLINLFFGLIIFCSSPSYLEILIKFSLLLLINSFFLTLVSWFMFLLSSYQNDLEGYAFSAMLYEQVPIHSRQFYGILPASLIMVFSLVIIQNSF